MLQIYYELISLCWVAFFATWAISVMVFRTAGRRHYSPLARGARLLLFVAIVIGLRLAGSVPFQSFRSFGVEAAAVGVAFCVVGLAFAVWARVTLGRNWGMPMTRHEDPELVTSGPYRYVRHPIYTGLIAMFVGTTFVFPPAAVPCAFTIAYSVFSAVREERDMARRFPEAYPEYRKHSKMFVPFLL